MFLYHLPLRSRKSLAHDTIEVALSLGTAPFPFVSGQYIRVTLLTPPTSDLSDSFRDFSITSLPGDPELTFAFRESHSPFKQTLLKLPIGERVGISGPHGTFSLPDTTVRPVVFYAGGIGITAFISKLRTAARDASGHDITLIWQDSEQGRAAYLSEIESLTRADGFRFTFIPVFEPERTVTTSFLKTRIPRYREAIWQVAGPAGMIEHVGRILDELHLTPDQRLVESYDTRNARRRVSAVLLPESPEEQVRTAGLLDALNQTAIVSETDADGTIIFVNDKFAEVSGYTKEELVGQNHRLLKSGHHPDSFFVDLWRIIASGKPWRGEIKNRAKDGSYYWVDTSIAPILDATGTPVRFVSVRFVISDRKTAEEELRLYREGLESLVRERTKELSMTNESLEREIAKRQKLEQDLRAQANMLSEADKRKDEFLAVLSHELRNPLAPILATAELMKGYKIDDPEVEEFFSLVEHQARQMARILQDLLDVSRFLSGTFRLERQDVELDPIIKKAVRTAKSFIDAGGHTLSVVPAPKSIHLFADPVRIEQILVNLLTNAAKFTHPRGSITVRTRLEDDQVAIAIKDTGVGIPQESLDKIFVLFSQVNGDPLSRAKGGLGIGLSLARNLAVLHGGSIEVRSAGKMQGSEFIVRLPARAGTTPAMEHTPPPDDAHPPVRLRVLVVDDNRDMARTIGKVIEKLFEGEVRLAFDGAEALGELERFNPDVIILDLAMPGLDGYQVAQRIRGQPKFSTIPIIALSGFGQETDKERTRQAGFNQHLVKPVSVAELKQALATVQVGKS
jgi:PAS domain S-box-containing protein